ncbi:hypothetical protein MSR1_36940 [Magnetospirillum gryphiswaldense MSR-1]|nr:hypothetical protein MSR1_36940 [Magnetospirillum gryphiswaldense MSR-1]AVM80056.1 hypothetical protein MSR1L_36940 [Magnetospirillum gryphiswaldense]
MYCGCGGGGDGATSSPSVCWNEMPVPGIPVVKTGRRPGARLMLAPGTPRETLTPLPDTFRWTPGNRLIRRRNLSPMLPPTSLVLAGAIVSANGRQYDRKGCHRLGANILNGCWLPKACCFVQPLAAMSQDGEQSTFPAGDFTGGCDQAGGPRRLGQPGVSFQAGRIAPTLSEWLAPSDRGFFFVWVKFTPRGHRPDRRYRP